MWLEAFEFWTFIAGLGLFLFAMSQIEQSLSALGSRSFKVFLRNHTKNHFEAIAGGVVATAILQSSSVVGLMTLAFVGAGIIEMTHALGIVIGSNLGTTFTGWIVTTLGFKLKLTQYYLPLIGVGALGLSLLRQDYKIWHWCRFLLGLGFLLMGLVLMKESIEKVAATVDVSVLGSYGVLVYFLFGVFFTAMIQSSSATMVITLSALSVGVITLENAAALIIGADLGTTGTVIIGGLKGSAGKRQVAMAHFFFNLVTDLVALMLLPVLLYVVTNVYGLEDPLLALVALHSSFNVVGIALFTPFLNPFASFLQRTFPERGERINRHLHKVPSSVVDAALPVLRKELFHLCEKVSCLSLRFFELPLDRLNAGPEITQVFGKKSMESAYTEVKRLEAEIIDYIYEVQERNLGKQQTSQLNDYQSAAREAVYASKAVKDIYHDLQEFRHSAKSSIEHLNQTISDQVGPFYANVLVMLSNEDPVSQKEQYRDLVNNARAFHQEFHWVITRQDSEDQLNDLEVSTVFNVNREVYMAQVALLRSCAKVIFRAELQEAMESILD